MLIDLQLHSIYSDGYLTPSQLADFLSESNIKIAALTDHNTVGGLEEFKLACQKKNIKAINGLELYAKLGHRKFNLLWYNFDSRDPELHNLLRASQTRRRRQIRNALIKLKQHGFKINENRLLDKFNHYIPLNHLIDHIYKIPANKKIIVKKLKTAKPGQDEILMKIFKNPAFVKISESYISLKQIIKLKKKINGQLILNHPGKHNHLDKKFIASLKKLGIDGLEVISPHHSLGAIMYTRRLAREYKLIMAGGSDFHRFEPTSDGLNNCYDYFRIDSDYLTDIKKIIG
ncbi:MAG: PHP domain-containing protein [Patescibacteria group bacterium]|nr:PHP domain-containing protein [Patescibacteria group bacterium]